MQNLEPFFAPDYEILDEVQAAVAEKDTHSLGQLEEMSLFLKRLRAAQIWYSSMPVSATDIIDLPVKYVSDVGDARLVAGSLREFVSDGLGIKIPTNIPIEKYAELVREFQPAICKALSELLSGSERQPSDFSAVAKQISRVNAEIDRMKNLKRYMLLESVVETCANNKGLVAAGIITGALGLGGSLWGCVGAAGAGVAGKAARKFGVLDGRVKLSGAKHLKKLGGAIHREIQPAIDRLLAVYLSSDVPSVSVLEIRRRLAN